MIKNDLRSKKEIDQIKLKLREKIINKLPIVI